MRTKSNFIHIIPIGVIVVAVCARGMLSSEFPILQRVVRSLSASFLSIVFYYAILIAINRYLPELSIARIINRASEADYQVGQRVDITVGSEGKRSRVKQKGPKRTHSPLPSVAPARPTDSESLRDTPRTSGPSQQYSTPVAKQRASDILDGAPTDTLGNAVARAAAENPEHIANVLRNLVAGGTSQGLKK